MDRQISNSEKWWMPWYVAVISALATSIVAASFSQFSTTLAQLSEMMNVSQDKIALSDPLKSAAVVVAMIISPAVMKKIGMRATFILGVIAFIVPQILIPYIPSFPILLVLKVIQGFCALIFPLSLIIIMQWSKSENMGLATSIFTGIVYSGGAVGATIAGIAITMSGWQASYHCLNVIMIVLAVIFLLTVREKKTELSDALQEDKGAYSKVVRSKHSYLLILAYLPTIWAIQAVWADLAPYGSFLEHSDTEIGGVMGFSSLAILLAALISGKTSDILAARSKNKVIARILALSIGAILIIIGVILMVTLELTILSNYNITSLIFSFGAAWGLGAFYCIIPEIYVGEQIDVANGFLGGIADIAMPISPIVIAVVGIGMGLWNYAWLSCIAVCAIGLISSMVVVATRRERSLN